MKKNRIVIFTLASSGTVLSIYAANELTSYLFNKDFPYPTLTVGAGLVWLAYFIFKRTPD